MLIFFIILWVFIEKSKNLKDYGLITILSNSTLNKKTATNISKTLQNLLKNSAIDSKIEPNQVDANTATFDIYIDENNRTNNSEISSHINEIFSNESKVKNFILENSNISLESVWFINDNQKLSKTTDESKNRVNFIVLIAITLIIILTLFLNFIHCLKCEKVKNVPIVNEEDKEEENVSNIHYQIIKSYRLEKQMNPQKTKEKKSNEFYLLDLDYSKNANFLKDSETLNLLNLMEELETIRNDSNKFQTLINSTSVENDTKEDDDILIVDSKNIMQCCVTKVDENFNTHLLELLSMNSENIYSKPNFSLVLSFSDAFKEFDQFIERQCESGVFKMINTVCYNDKIYVTHVIFDSSQNKKVIAFVKSRFVPLENEGIHLDDGLLLRWLMRSIIFNLPLLIIYKSNDELKKISPFIVYDIFMQNILENKKQRRNVFENVLTSISKSGKELLVDRFQITLGLAFILNEIEFLLDCKKSE